MIKFMSSPVEQLGMYLHLARASQQRQRPLVRDRLLVLAGAIAVEMGLNGIAAYCRQQILDHNPRHFVGHWPSLQLALPDEEFQSHRRQLLRRFPQEKVEQMLDSLGIQMAREREVYFSDYEYAAAILGTTPQALDALFDDSDENT